LERHFFNESEMALFFECTGSYAPNLLDTADIVRDAMLRHLRGACYDCRMFNFGNPKTAGDWIVHIAGAIVAIFLVWWMLRMYVL
jgi:hypothetical protein